MNIVVTDGYTLNNGDLSWHALAQLGTLTVYDRTPADLIVPRCMDADIVLTNKVPFSRDTLAQLPQLQCICVLATGYNVIDTTAAKENGIVVCNVPGYGTASVAQHAFALLLELTNNVGLHSTTVRQGKWQHARDWCYTEKPIMELWGKTFGIIGLGSIGLQAAHIAAAFGMKVAFYNPSLKQGVKGEQKSLTSVFEESDVVSLHCPLKENNAGFVNYALLQKMKPTAYLLNTSRGQLIHEPHLARALDEGVIAGAALDVLSSEPPSENNPLLQARNCLITPHNAWMSKEARQRIMDITAQNITAFLKGMPANRVG